MLDDSIQFFNVRGKRLSAERRQAGPHSLASIYGALSKRDVASGLKLFQVLGQNRVTDIKFVAQHLKLGLLQWRQERTYLQSVGCVDHRVKLCAGHWEPPSSAFAR